MNTNNVAFEFIDVDAFRPNLDEFVVDVPKGIRSKADLISHLSQLANFPASFGRNWDALLDALRDLSWIPNRSIVVLHRDIPLRNEMTESKIYLDLLTELLHDWAGSPELDAIQPPSGWDYIHHDLRILFPRNVEADLRKMLKED